MHTVKQHFAFKIVSLLAVVMLLIPTIVKFTHTFNHHTHKVCTGEKSTHLHKVDLDCEFFKFQTNKNFTFTSFIIDLFSEQEIQPEIESQYVFLSDYQRLRFLLRGPPQINLV